MVRALPLTLLALCGGCCFTVTGEVGAVTTGGSSGVTTGSTTGHSSGIGTLGSSTSGTTSSGSTGAGTTTSGGSCDGGAGLSITPDPIAYSNLQMGQSLAQNVAITNVGCTDLAVSCISLDSQSNGGDGTACGNSSSIFGFSSVPGLPEMLPPRYHFDFTLTYTASGGNNDGDQLDVFYAEAGSPSDREATALVVGTVGVLTPCALTIAPAALNFGVVTLGTPTQRTLTLTNTGQTTCEISSVELNAMTDVSYALDSSQATTFPVAPGTQGTITVDFNLNNSSTPTTRLGTLDFETSDPNHPLETIPLTAFLVCDCPYLPGWPKWHFDNYNSGHTTADTSANVGTVLWKNPSTLAGAIATGGDAGLSYLNSPVVADLPDGSYAIYQTSLDGRFYAFDPNGQEIFEESLGVPISNPQPSTPNVAPDGDVYLVTGAALTRISGNTISEDVYGTALSACPVLETTGNLLEAEALGASGSADDPYSIFELNLSLSDGLVLPLTARAPRFGIALANDGTSYWASNGQIFGVTAPPLALLSAWPSAGVTQPGTFGAADAGPVSSDLAIDPISTNSVFAYSAWTEGSGASRTAGGVLQSLDLTNGAVNWTVSLPQTPIPQTNLLSHWGNAAPAYDLASSQVYVGNSDGLRAIDMTTGVQNWLFGSADVTSSPAIGGDGTIFFGCEDGSFYALNPDGTLRYQIPAAAPISSSPAIADDGTVYFVSDDGVLWAVK